MKAQRRGYWRPALVSAWGCLLLFGVALVASPALPGIKSLALIVAADSKLPDLTLADLTKLSKGTKKSWPDGRNFTLVLKDPDAPEMHVVMQKIFGVSGPDAKVAIAKINESRPLIKIVASDDDVFRTVASVPGAVGIVDVYSINSSVKVLHIDGKLPFDIGYALK